MTKIELNTFRDTLMHKKAELEREHRGRGTLALEATSDEMDRIQLGQERDRAIDHLDRNAKLQRAVRAALARIDCGTFGICLDCEEDISLRRLAAVPWTALCIVCQEAADSSVEQPWSAGEELLAEAG
jgi:DnaK suppressor protein